MWCVQYSTVRVPNLGLANLVLVLTVDTVGVLDGQPNAILLLGYTSLLQLKQSTLSTMNENPVVFFDITLGGSPKGRIEMELRADIVPKTAEVRVKKGW